MPYGCVYSEMSGTSGVGGRSRPRFRTLLTQDRIHAAETSHECDREPTSHVVANMESMFVSGATLHAQRSCANGQ